jgi:type III secretion system FlhB-like substrate exporter
MFILDDLLFKLPAKGFMGIFKRIAEMAEEELNDDARVKEELLQLEFLFETDQIPEEEYEERVAALMERLNSLEEQREDDMIRM